ncbi:response regulator transcription factor [Candidatus Manganitrophus noduliformans]|uniref:Response regulator transcription factor n=1 Tax=Candidatus Manganitrophus noduliformans TaxID=2606439 RepID=A0A7X6DTY4_9BACT|nr:response regulator transcription factor [Candidatus Manganitrophus noduliformans]NKE73245.1 response regulator transcription factor [Candidatus Manganitrophus noduliformans]
MSQKILMVDDEADLSKLVAHHLQKEGFEPLCVSNGSDALKALAKQPFSLVILDIMMPGEDGLQVCRKLRNKEETASIPILFLTAKDEESDKVVGLELGADDYVTKPFSPKELMARVKALLRRTERKESASSYAYRDLVMDVPRHEVSASENRVTLTAKEFALLEHLLKNKGKVLTRDHLLNTVWGYDYFGTTRTVDVHVRRLREKIPLLTDAIETVPSLGYKLVDEE